MIEIDQKEVKKLESDLLFFARRSYPYAAKETVNTLAWKTRSESHAQIGHWMVERNRWTRGSIRVNQAKGLRVSSMQSEVGSTEEYMLTQEDGGIKRSSGRHGVPIPTGYSAGQEGSRPRTRMPRRPNRMTNIKLRKGFRNLGASPNQRLVVAVNEAVRTGRRFLFLEVGKYKMRAGMYRVLGGRYLGRGWPGNARLKMVVDMSKPVVRIPPTKWLSTATSKVEAHAGSIYARALSRQLRRQRLL